jgi:Polysaccharide biosynthesis/export protein
MRVQHRIHGGCFARQALIIAGLLCCPFPFLAGTGQAQPAAAVQQDSVQKQDAAHDQPCPDTGGFVKPGEAIRIYAFPDTSSFVNGFYPVDGRGRIYLPIIGKMNVSGMSEKTLLDTLKAQFINYLKYPNLQVRRLVRISLLGGFQRPGLYYIDPDYSLWDAVNQTGGTVRDDGLLQMRWERDRKIVTRDIIPFYQSGRPLSSIGFRSGDQFCTPGEPKNSWWNAIVRDVVLSQVFPIITTGASLYISYLMYKTYKTR